MPHCSHRDPSTPRLRGLGKVGIEFTLGAIGHNLTRWQAERDPKSALWCRRRARGKWETKPSPIGTAQVRTHTSAPRFIAAKSAAGLKPGSLRKVHAGRGAEAPLYPCSQGTAF